MASVYKHPRKGDNWYAAWTDHTGKRRTKCTLTTDKASAERFAKKFEADAALRREGVIDPHLESVAAQGRRSIETHLADYRAKLEATGRSAYYVRDTEMNIRAFAKRPS